MNDDLKTLVAIREILGSALREMAWLPDNHITCELEKRIVAAYYYIENVAIRQHEKENSDDPKRDR